jgi:anaphase-promoting complex subunit 2
LFIVFTIYTYKPPPPPSTSLNNKLHRLTDEKAGGDLYEELRRQDATLLESGYETEDDEVPPDPNWVPSSTPQQQALAAALASHCQSSKTIPISASDRMKQQQRPQEDILSMLVSIYGSQELFVNEYRMMLSDKLLANLDFDTDKEVHTLELLKLRFGETSLRQCEIMIKDIDDSKRIVSNIHSTIAAAQRESRNLSMVVDAAIVSHIFWPPLLKDDMKAHPKIQSQLDLFGKEYANLKNPRKLIWLHQLGTVTVELEFLDDQSNHGRALPKGFKTKKEFTCSPIQATLITHFEDKESWTAVDLARETNVSEETIRRKMGYWLNQRVVQCRDTIVDDLVHGGGRTATVLYTLCSSFLSGDAFNEQLGSSFSEDGNTEIMAEYDEYEDNAIQAKAQEAEEMKVYESYIVGMLTNLGPLPLERIHNMLKMFVTGSELKYDKTPQELSSFLDYLCNQDKLEYSDRMYKLVKK